MSTKKTKSEPVKVALIGAGNMANLVHYPAISTFPDVAIVGLCDLDEEKLKNTAEKFNIKNTFSDYQEMLEQTKPDAVYVLMPPHMIFNVAMNVMETGVHLFVEKPPAVTTFQAECMAHQAAEKGIVSAVGFQRRYHPMAQACWQEVCKRGTLNQVVSTFYKNQPPATTHPYYCGAIDILHCDAIHAVDSLRYYAGLAEIEEVYSEVSNVDCWYATRFNALVRFANGVVGNLLTNWRTGRRLLKFEFHANTASAFVDIDGEGSVWADNAPEPVLKTTSTEHAGSEEMHMHQGFHAESRAFIDAVRSGSKLHNDLADAVKTMQLADLIYQNATKC